MKDRVAESVSAIGALLSAFLALAAVIASAIAVGVSLRTARYASEPWLELEPRKAELSFEWEIDKSIGVVATCRASSEGRYPLWATNYDFPGWKVLNLGSGPARNIVANWQLEKSSLKQIIDRFSGVFGETRINHGDVKYGPAESAKSILFINSTAQSFLGFCSPTPFSSNNSDLDLGAHLRIPVGIIGSIALITLSSVEKSERSGKFTGGKITVELSFQDRFGRGYSRPFLIKYTSESYRETIKEKTIVKGEIQLQVKQLVSTVL